jgi:2-polyprenyl-3-methyl-5-hydroxy-6-metoxy-1,4-benzoquinol methylase
LPDLMEKFIEAFFASPSPPAELRKATTYLNSVGHPLFGFSCQELPRAVMEYGWFVEHHDYEKADTLVRNLRLSLEIEDQARWVLQGLFTPPLLEFVGKAAQNYPQFRGVHLKDLDRVMILYAEFSGKPIDEIRAIAEHWEVIYAKLWAACGGEHQDPPAPNVMEFYRTLPFPIGSSLHGKIGSHLALSIAAQPVLLALSQHATRVIDIGGNDGLVTSAMAAAGIPEVVLAEQNEHLLAFASWRDQRAGIRGVKYQRISEVLGTLESRAGSFDLAVCTEVLEHLSDVEACVRMLAKLIRSGGLLFLSASFGLPQPSHLVANRKYHRGEVPLLARHGFELCRLTTNVSLSNVWLFRRTAQQID